MKSLICSVAMGALLAASGVQAAPAPDAEIAAMSAYQAHHDAGATIAKYFKTCGGPDGGYGLVATGDPRAVKVGLVVYGHGKGCQLETIIEAFGLAMRHNPALVLRDMSSVCWSTGFVAAPTDADYKTAIEETEHAVSGVSDPALAKARQNCLKELADARKTYIH